MLDGVGDGYLEVLNSQFDAADPIEFSPISRGETKSEKKNVMMRKLSWGKQQARNSHCAHVNIGLQRLSRMMLGQATNYLLLKCGWLRCCHGDYELCSCCDAVRDAGLAYLAVEGSSGSSLEGMEPL
ncbi:Uncharacterized protein HZ326_0627 [Fusarium oxysporum f. sp. albedinis]|nr:Uncharacterized protein HZ326_0627 [Fusarium oxysporum f. sp. albedinis]